MAWDKSFQSRFWSKVQQSNDCWVWTAGKTVAGYGRFSIGRRGNGSAWDYSHRLSYVMMIADIPEGMVLDHLCRNPACVNPYHLDLVTHQVNILRGEGLAALNAVKTHCIRGHEFTEENTYVRPGGRKRMCRTCSRESPRRSKIPKGS